MLRKLLTNSDARAIYHRNNRVILNTLFVASKNDYYYDDNLEKEMEKIQRQATSLNNNKEINLNSPKQIANALYKDSMTKERGTGKRILQSLAAFDQNFVEEKGNDDSLQVTSFQKELADLVLQYRELKQRLQSIQRKNGVDVSSSTEVKSKFSPLLGQEISSRSLSTSTKPINQESNSQKKDKPSVDNNGANTNNIDSVDNMFHQHHHSTTTAYNLKVQSLFKSSKSKINEYWKEPLQSISKPSARAIVSQLNLSCSMGYDPIATPYDHLTIDANERGGQSKKNPTTTTAGKKGSLLSYVREQKEKFSDCIILTRVGEFYEAFGIDALLLIEHCGLNSMAGKARAGCPLKNIQATLDGLTTAGYRVAVYEEATDTDASLGGKGVSGGPKSRIKNRMLAQIVSPASPTYLYNLVLGDSESTSDALFGTPSARPYVGIISNAAGYTLVEISSEERTVRVSERLTAEAVACHLSAYPPAEPLIYVPSHGDESQSLPFLPSNADLIKDGPGSKFQVKHFQPHLYMPSPRVGFSDVERSKQCIVNALLQMIDTKDKNGENGNLSNDDFILFPTCKEMSYSNRTTTNPLYVETATQLGLMSDPTIPKLVKYLLPDSAPLPTKRFLRRWLLTPPPPDVSKSMSDLILTLKDDDIALPPMVIPPVGKVLSLIRAGQASAQVFRDILTSIDSTVSILSMYSKDPDVVAPLMTILRYESGIDAQPDNLKERCLDATQIISNVVCTHHDGKRNKDQISHDGDGIVPYAFFERNEAAWRGRVKPENAEEAYERVRSTAEELVQAIAVDFWGADDDYNLNSTKEIKSPLVQDIFNNLIALKEVPSWASKASGAKDLYYHPRDRNGKLLRNRYTTARVEDAVSRYVEACDFATASISFVLTQLSETLCESGHLPAISQAAHTNLILSTVSQHTAQANHLGWNMATISEPDDNGIFQFTNVWPYWMDKSESILNSFDLNGMFLLTAPNMSGKSTIMRSSAAAALLSNCGLCSPIESGSVPRFDNIFVRGASSDVPTENKSAFGAEMQDIAALLRVCGKKSIVFVDELGRGTSPTDGAALAAAVLEEMAASGMKGFFATHLHSILNLPMKDRAWSNIYTKRMETAEGYWTYKLVNGVCTDSQAFKTAAKFGIPNAIIKRAEELSVHVDKQNHKSPHVESQPPMPEISNNDRPQSYDKIGDDQVKEISRIIETTSGQSATHIPPNWTPPPSLEGNSVVYIIIVGDRFYIGETDSIAQRMRQHRSKNGWSNIAAVVVKVDGGKTVARNLESILIRKFASEGLPLVSVTDGRKISPLNRQS